jgi:capsular exopolysaccharide synthesis family protein
MTQNATGLAALADSYPRQTPAPEPTINVFLVLRRQKWPLILCACLGLALGLLHYFTSPKTYYAATSILISEQASTPQEELSASVPMLRNETTVLNEMQVLRSLQLADRVAANINVEQANAILWPPVSMARDFLTIIVAGVKSYLPDLEAAPIDTGEIKVDSIYKAAALTLQRDVGLTRVGRTFAIEISYIHSDPVLAATIVNGYATTYLQDRQLANLEAADRSTEWLLAHIEEVRVSANAAAAEAEAFRMNNRASNNQTLRQLEQRASTLNDLHAALLRRYEMITIEGSYPVTNGRILSAAVVPQKPALPKAWRILAVCLVLGLMVGFAVAAWRETRENVLRTGQDVRDLTGLPFLGYLNKFRPARLARLFSQFEQNAPHSKAQGLFRWLPGVKADAEKPVKQIEMADCDPSYLLQLIAPDAPYCETIKNVLATLDLTAPTGDNRVIAIGSLNQGEGRSTVAANLAQLAAMEGQRVLLIDADLPNPELSRQFNFKDEVGLHDVLAGHVPFDDAVFHLPDTGLSILPGRLYAERGDLAMMGKLSKMLEQARSQFDTIIVDFQPLAVSSDLKANLSSIDSVVLLAEWSRTSKQSLKQYIDNEPQLRAKTIGVLLNQTVARKLPLYGVARTEFSRRRAPGFA